MPRPFWYDIDEATQDLREVLTSNKQAKTVPGWLPAFEGRSFSAASTCATSPPPAMCLTPAASTLRGSGCGWISEPASPERSFNTAPSEMGSHSPAPWSASTEEVAPRSPALAEQPPRPPGALDKSSWMQARKIFVGGIPQTVDQNGLYQMFTKIGNVKKAWLQLFHNEKAANQMIPTGKKHRGFGFVIFHEKDDIEQLFGNTTSRFISFGDIKLEVKLAFGKTNSPDEVPSSGKKTKQQVKHILASPTPSQAHQSGSWVPSSPAPAPRQSSFLAPASSSPDPQTRFIVPSLSSPAPQASKSGSWVPSSASPSPQSYQTWQGLPAQKPLASLPRVPPFPIAEERVAPQAVGLVSSSTETSASAAVQRSPSPFLPEVLLHGLAGRRPSSSQEWTEALLAAMPECYED